MAPLGLKVLGMEPDEWGAVEPAAATQIGAALERKSTVFDQILRSHLQEWKPGATSQTSPRPNTQP